MSEPNSLALKEWSDFHYRQADLFRSNRLVATAHRATASLLLKAHAKIVRLEEKLAKYETKGTP